MRILLQVPGGLKRKIIEIVAKLEKDGHTVFVSGENCYGACDLREGEVKLLKVDKIIHYGHTRFMKSDIPVEYREIRENIDVLPILEKEWQKISEKKICLITSLQFVDNLEGVKLFLEENGKAVVIPEGRDDEKKIYPGQVLGCCSSVPKADAYLYIGSGSFHATSKELVGKSVYSLDVERGEIRIVDSSQLLKQKYAAIGLAKHANSFGILVSSRRGQFGLAVAEEIRNKLKEQGKHALMIIMDEFSPDKLMGIEVDCWINTACPRISIDNRTAFGKPIVNVDELNETGLIDKQ
jgi:2-(3-amino-3-carboxypropyl)histidine synthase